MKFKRIAQFGLFSLVFISASYSQALDSIAQVLQIYTHFHCVVDKPSWLLELRDLQSGQVFPYLFDVKNNDNFWVAFTKEHDYEIVASEMKFGRCAEIHNFCHLENTVLCGKSMYITLSGVISPDRRTTSCHVLKYSSMQFTIAKPEVVVTTSQPPPPIPEAPPGTTPLQAVMQAATSGAPPPPPQASGPKTTISAPSGGGPASAKSLVTSVSTTK